MKLNVMICVFAIIHIFCLSCELYTAPSPLPSHIATLQPIVCQPAVDEPLYFDYCTEYDSRYGCTCVAFIGNHDGKCRTEYCYYFDTCQWEFYDAYCIH